MSSSAADSAASWIWPSAADPFGHITDGQVGPLAISSQSSRARVGGWHRAPTMDGITLSDERGQGERSPSRRYLAPVPVV
jgi:hypothetical protein